MPLILTEKTGINLAVDGGNLDVSTEPLVAADLLTLIKTVDGAASGLDADLLDGQEASAFVVASVGTWTPAWVIAGGSATTGVNEANYVKIGPLVLASFSISLTSFSGTGTVTITGLPFAALSDIDYKAGVSFGRVSLFNTAMTYLRGYVTGGGTTIFLEDQATNASSATLVQGTDMATNALVAGTIVYQANS